MFWIMGAQEIIYTQAKEQDRLFGKRSLYNLSIRSGMVFMCTILFFRSFLFLAGVATPYSVGRELENGKAKSELLLRVIKRGFLLVLLGLIYNNGLQIKPFSEIRFGSVLGRIGLAYMFANIIYIYAGRRAQVIWFSALLIGYWLLLKLNAAPGFAAGDLTMQGNFASYLDRLIMPGKLYLGIHDPEGLTSTIPAISTGLLGIFAGTLLRSNQLN